MTKDKKTIVIVSIIGSIAVILLIAVVILVSMITSKNQALQILKETYEETQTTEAPVEIQTIDIEGEIQKLGELNTAKYAYTITQSTEKPNVEIAGYEIPLTASKVIYSYSGEVKAGVQCSDIKVVTSKMDDGKTLIQVYMPEAEITSTEIDNDSLVVYDEHNFPFNEITFEDINLSMQECKDKGEIQAREAGVMEDAEKNAEAVIRSLVSGLYEKGSYELQFLDSEE